MTSFPACGRKVTVGVMHRVEKLADRVHGYKPKDSPGFRSIVPLPEIISEIVQVGVNSKRVAGEYMNILNKVGNEFHILLDAKISEIEKHSPPLLGKAISKMRSGDIYVVPGYDGEFGKVRIFE